MVAYNSLLEELSNVQKVMLTMLGQSWDMTVHYDGVRRIYTTPVAVSPTKTIRFRAKDGNEIADMKRLKLVSETNKGAERHVVLTGFGTSVYRMIKSSKFTVKENN